MSHNSLAGFLGKIKTFPVSFQHIYHAEAVLMVSEAGLRVIGAVSLVQAIFASMAEGRMTQVVREYDRLAQCFVHPQGDGETPCNLGRLERVCETCSKVVVLRRSEHLRLALESPE